VFGFTDVVVTSPDKNRNDVLIKRGRKILHITIASYILMHSISEHKEFRFILPILPLVCILAGHAIDQYFLSSSTPTSSYSFLVSSWLNRLPRQRKMSILCVAIILLNYPHLLFLCRIHQRAPIEVNKFITGTIQSWEVMKHNTSTSEEETALMASSSQLLKNVDSSSSSRSHYSIHYLMGCHSTPLYSHLHVPNVRIDAWTLDCSPSCRSNPHVLCESDLFHRDPALFVKTSYGLNKEETNLCSKDNGSDELCPNASTMLGPTTPDFLVIFENEANQIRDLLGELGFKEMSRFSHSIESLTLYNTHDDPENGRSNSTSLFHGFEKLLHYRLGVNFDHVILFVRDK